MIQGSFTKKKIGTLTLGEKLRKLRSDKRISINEASRVTKIQAKYLEFLEEGNYDKLPADVYVRGFLRSYAEFLIADDKVLIKLFEKEKGIKKNLEKTNPPSGIEERMKPISISSFVFTPKKIIITGSFLLFILGIFYLSREIGSFTDAPRLVVLNPQENAEVEGSSIDVSGMTDRDARLFINDQPVLVNDDGKFRENITLQPGVNNINIKSINRFEKEADRQITVRSNMQDLSQDSNEASKDETGGEQVPTDNELQMELRVDPGPVWISVEADGKLVFSGNMLSGSVQSFKANEKIIIDSGKANATFIKFNGKDIGTLGTESGSAKGVTFTKDTKY